MKILSTKEYSTIGKHGEILLTEAEQARADNNRKKDEWSGFADLLANLIEKYAGGSGY